MHDRTTSVEQNNTTSTTCTSTPESGTASSIGTATELEFGSLMAPVSWWATSTQQEQISVWEMYRESGELDVDFVSLARDYASAAELLDNEEECQGEDSDTDQEVQGQGQEQPAAVQPAEPVPTATLAQANATLQRFGQQCRSATDLNYALGQLAAQYVDEFLGAAPGKSTRTTAVERLAGEWLLWDEESMAEPQAAAMKRLRAKVNVLLRGNAVAGLLGDGWGIAKGDGTRRGKGKGKGKQESAPIGWGKLRELSPLVERDANDYSEVWHVLAGVADKAASLVAEIASSGMAREDVVKAVAKLVDEERTARLEAAKRMAAAEKAAADAARAAELEARQSAKMAERAAEQATAAVEQAATPEEKEQAQDAAAKALEQLRAEQAKAAAATEAAALAAKRLARQQTEEREAASKQAEAEARKAAKEAKREGRTATAAPPTPTANQGTNLLAVAKLGTLKDVAEMVVELLRSNDTPTDLWEAVLGMMREDEVFDRHVQHSVKAAQVGLTNSLARSSKRQASLSPADVANRLTVADGNTAAHLNGQLAAAS